MSANRSNCAANAGCSDACTRPRWRSGSVSAASRGTAPSTGSRIAAATARRCFSLPTRFSTTPPTRTAGWKLAIPWATAAAVCAWPDTSSTSSTGSPHRAARSAALPVRPAGPATPSNRPMALSTTRKSASAAAAANRPSSRAGGMAQLSRFTPGAPDAAAWKAGSM